VVCAGLLGSAGRSPQPLRQHRRSAARVAAPPRRAVARRRLRVLSARAGERARRLPASALRPRLPGRSPARAGRRPCARLRPHRRPQALRRASARRPARRAALGQPPAPARRRRDRRGCGAACPRAAHRPSRPLRRPADRRARRTASGRGVRARLGAAGAALLACGDVAAAARGTALRGRPESRPARRRLPAGPRRLVARPGPPSRRRRGSRPDTGAPRRGRPQGPGRGLERPVAGLPRVALPGAAARRPHVHRRVGRWCGTRGGGAARRAAAFADAGSGRLGPVRLRLRGAADPHGPRQGFAPGALRRRRSRRRSACPAHPQPCPGHRPR